LTDLIKTKQDNNLTIDQYIYQPHIGMKDVIIVNTTIIINHRASFI